MVKDLVIAISLGILSTLLLSLSILGSDGGANYGTALQSLALWTLSLVPIFFSGLGFGVMSAVISVITGAIIASVLLSPVFGITYAVLVGAPVIVLVRQALLWRGTDEEKSWYPVGYLIIWWAGICVALTIAAMVVVNMNDELRQGMIAGFDQMLTQLKELNGVSATMTAEEFVARMPQYIGPMWGLFVLLSGTLAQGLLVRFGKNQRPTPKLTEMELPRWAALAFVAAVVLSILLDGIWPVLGAIVITLEIAFFLQGMAVVHVVSHRWKSRPILLGAIYMVLIIMLWPFLLVTVLGLMENWIGFRRRFAVTTHQEED